MLANNVGNGDSPDDDSITVLSGGAGIPSTPAETASDPEPDPTPAKKKTRGGKRFLLSSKLPPGADFIGRQAQALARALEAAVRQRRGKVTVTDRERINRAIRYEVQLKLLDRWLAAEAGSIPLADRMRLLAQQATASESRGRAFGQLGLDVKGTIFDAITASDHDDTAEPEYRE